MLIGADKCLNYKSSNFAEELEKVCNDEVDIYFDNVGGEILDNMLLHIKQHGVVVACGGVSGYNDKEPTILKSKHRPFYGRLTTDILQITCTLYSCVSPSAASL